jgi:hypothetical protein
VRAGQVQTLRTHDVGGLRETREGGHEFHPQGSALHLQADKGPPYGQGFEVKQVDEIFLGTLRCYPYV